MRIIQTTYNSIDFQSRIITLDMEWNSFKDKIFEAINNGDYIKDNEVNLKSEPLLLGTLVPKVDNGVIIQNDDKHLMIVTTRYNKHIEVLMFYLLYE